MCQFPRLPHSNFVFRYQFPHYSYLGTSYGSTSKMFDEWHTRWDPDSGNSVSKDHPNSRITERIHRLSFSTLVNHCACLYSVSNFVMFPVIFLLHWNIYKTTFSIYISHPSIPYQGDFNNHPLKNVLRKFDRTTLSRLVSCIFMVFMDIFIPY